MIIDVERFFTEYLNKSEAPEILMSNLDDAKLDQIVAKARQERELREQGYRAQALKMYPHICGRCGSGFTRTNLHELTVHHRDHNHDNNPSDGSNWELLCLYCHDNEHQRHQDNQSNSLNSHGNSHSIHATSNPFAGLKEMLDAKNRKP